MFQVEKYNYINTIDKLKQLDSYLMEDNKPRFNLMAVDTETNGLLLYRSTIIGFSLSVNEREGFYCPLMEWIPDPKSLKTKSFNKKKYDIYVDGHFKCVWTGKIYPEFVKPNEYEMPEFIPMFVQRWFSCTNLIMHNAPFDINMIFACMGVDITNALLMDTSLLSHILNENSPNGLKRVAKEYKDELGIDPNQMANQEQIEMAHSVLINGGKVSKAMNAESVWRADPLIQCKYASADTFLTFGVYLVLMQKYITEFGEDRLKWLFEDEVMPLCKENVVEMKRRGVYIDAPYFNKLNVETKNKMNELEDQIIKKINHLVIDFPLGKSIEEELNQTAIVKYIAELENLKLPQKFDKKEDKYKDSLAKAVVTKHYNENPHWLWGYVIGEDEIKYSDAKLESVKKDLYAIRVGRRYRFNIGSDDHLRWLFFTKLQNNDKHIEKTDTGLTSVKAEVLESEFKEKYDWVKDLLLFKKLKKFLTSYIRPAVNLHLNGWLYMDMKQNGTISGRFACSGGLNLQTLPQVEEIHECYKCKSTNVEHNYQIELLVDMKCKDCGEEFHNIICPSAIKKGFPAPPGYKIVSADFSSLEPRCFAFMSGDDRIKDVYRKELDLYSKVFCDMFDDVNEFSPDPKAPNFLKKVNKKARNMTKPIVLSIPYGATAYQVAALLNKKKIIKNKFGQEREVFDVEYGQYIIDKYLSTYDKLANYMIDMDNQALTKGFIDSLCGRRRHFEFTVPVFNLLQEKRVDINTFIHTHSDKMEKTDFSISLKNGDHLALNNEELKEICKKIGLNYFTIKDKGAWNFIKNQLKQELNNAKNWPIQTLAGHITNRAMLDTGRKFRANNIDGWIALQIHDEILTYVKIEQAELGSNLLKSGMEDNIFTRKLDVPMIAEPTICDNIKDAK